MLLCRHRVAANCRILNKCIHSTKVNVIKYGASASKALYLSDIYSFNVATNTRVLLPARV